MAYDKIIPIRRRLDHCLAYAANEQKTDLAAALHYIGNERKTAPPHADRLRTGINCTVETAYAEMQATKRRWNKCGGILGYHIIHSYAPGEVTPQEAHAAGVEFARRLLGERYEAVVATHLDREHLHCHIVFNSVSLVDGSKYRSDFKSYFGTLRGTSNAVSRERGLSVIEPEHEGRHYAEWDAEKHSRPTVRGTVRADVDAALLRARSFSDFLTRLRAQGYEVRTQGKYLAVKPSGSSRYVRLKSFLMDVSAEAADLVVKEGLQATETAVKLAGSGIKNAAALLLALSKQDYKVIGQASAARLARDPNPPAVVQIRAEDLSRFRKMAAKQYGVLYLPVRKRGDDSGLITIVSTQTYAANLNCIMEELGYPVPVKETDEPKKAVPFAPSEKASNERGSISTASQERTTDDARSSVLGKLEAMRQLSAERNTDRIKVKEHIR